MADSFSLPLRPIRKTADDSEKLPIRIAQINAQKGSFRNVTEESLLDEIEALRLSRKEPSDAQDLATTADSTDEKEQQLFTSRSEMLEFATQAQVEAWYALDFVSLALSKHAPRQTEQSMTPYVKQKIPPGSLSIDRTQAAEQTQAEKNDVEAVSEGWKLESFSSAANKLLEAATRLQSEVVAETKYWSEVLAIKEEGWKICRLPRERQTLGVQHGFLEAAPIFRDRGLGALRRKDDGSLYFDQGTHAVPPQVVRIRIQEGERTVGISQPIYTRRNDSASTQETHIPQAKDSLFEEELFYELNREARALLRHGVETRQNQISFPLPDDRQVIFDLIPVAEAASLASETNLDEMPASKLAHAISCSIRIFLTHAHRKNHRKRTQVSTAIGARKRPAVEYPLLQPSLTYLQHRSDVQWLLLFLRDITGTLRSAGLDCKYWTQPRRPSPSKGGLATPTNQERNIPLVESLVDSFLSAWDFSVAGHYIGPDSRYKIRIRTDLGPNGLGTEFNIFTTLISSSQQQIVQRFGMREDLKEFLIHAFTLDLVRVIPLFGGMRNTSHMSSQVKPDANAIVGEEVTPIVSPKASIWEPTFPEKGELASRSPGKGLHRKLQVSLTATSLMLRCETLSVAEGTVVQEVRHTWHAVQAHNDSRLTLQEALKEMGSDF